MAAQPRSVARVEPEEKQEQEDMGEEAPEGVADAAVRTAQAVRAQRALDDTAAASPSRS